MISHDLLKQLVNYDPVTGSMTWRIARKGIVAGDEVGRFQRQGYRQVYIGGRDDGRSYYVHVLAVFYMTGKWPEHDVDHKNTQKSDNRWINLRLATRSQNKANAPKQANNKLGLRGVSWSERDKVYAWSVKRDAVRLRGTSDCPAAAHLAYLVASNKLFGEFAFVGR
jgi:hypothetical protein